MLKNSVVDSVTIYLFLLAINNLYNYNPRIGIMNYSLSTQ